MSRTRPGQAVTWLWGEFAKPNKNPLAPTVNFYSAIINVEPQEPPRIQTVDPFQSAQWRVSNLNLLNVWP